MKRKCYVACAAWTLTAVVVSVLLFAFNMFGQMLSIRYGNKTEYSIEEALFVSMGTSIGLVIYHVLVTRRRMHQK